MRALITGGTGFVGSHLAKLLAEGGVETFVASEGRTPPVSLTRLSSGLHWLAADVRDGAALKRVLREVSPQQIFHLAAFSSVPASWQSPHQTFETNVLGTLNLLEAITQLEPPPLLLNVSSAQVYGCPETPEVQFDESFPLRPLSPYATSKAMAELLCNQYVEARGAHIVTVRPFNHIGPGQSPEFACSSFARQIAQMERGLCPPVLQVGNLAVERDFADVRDVVRAYWLVMQRYKRGLIYNVCSGRTYSLSCAVEVLQSYTSVRVHIQPDPEKMRRQDPARIWGNPRKINSEIGWQPVIPFKESLRDLLEYWRGQVKSGDSELDIEPSVESIHYAEPNSKNL